MQYILSEEEYKNLVPKEKYEKGREKVEKLNKEVLDLFNGGRCLNEHGVYCDMCPIGCCLGIGTCTKTQRYSK